MREALFKIDTSKTIQKTLSDSGVQGNNFSHTRLGFPLFLPMWDNSISHTHTSLWEEKKNELPNTGCTLTRYVNVMLKWCHHVASQCIQYFLEAFFMFFQYKMRYLVVSKKKNPLFLWGWDRKIRPSQSPFVITRQASWWPNRWSSGRIFLSHSHTHDGSL